MNHESKIFAIFSNQSQADSAQAELRSAGFKDAAFSFFPNTQAFVGLGLDLPETTRLENRLSSGGVVMGIQCQSPDEPSKIRQILTRLGAEEINSAPKQKRPKAKDEQLAGASAS